MYTIKMNDATFTCNENEDVLTAAKKNFLKIPNGCCSGGCGMCKIVVRKGNYKRGTCSVAVLSENDRANNYSLACKTFPIDDLEIDIGGDI